MVIKRILLWYQWNMEKHVGDQRPSQYNALRRASFRKRMFARWYDRTMARYEQYMAERKRTLFAELAGNVLEIGPGTGANLAYVPRDCHWIGIEPNPYMHGDLVVKAKLASVDAEFRVSTAETIELGNESVDAVICTLVLCSVADPSQVLGEIMRVLKPGGRLYFIEHVAAPRKTWLRFSQRVVRPVWRFCADGCYPDRETGVAIENAGFKSVDMQSFPVPGDCIPRFAAPHIMGIAVK